jgi:hypothetical protein
LDQVPRLAVRINGKSRSRPFEPFSGQSDLNRRPELDPPMG